MRVHGTIRPKQIPSPQTIDSFEQWEYKDDESRIILKKKNK